MVVHEEIEYLLFGMDGVGGEGADELNIKAVLFCQLIASHGLFIIALRPLKVVQLLWPIQAGADGDMILGQDISQLGSQLPEIGLQGEIGLQVGQLIGQHRQGFPVEIGPGQKGLSAVEGECNRIVPEILEPGHYIRHRIQAHDR